MNIIRIVNNKNSKVLHELGSSFVPDVGEFIWYGENKSTYWKVTGRVIDFTSTKTLVINLLVEV